MPYDARKNWNKAIVSRPMEYPAEFLIRIFKGKYPRLDLRKNDYQGRRICDVGCGDGANLAFLGRCGFKVHGVEITDDIADKVKANLASFGIKADIRVGSNKNIPFKDGFFDYLVSWNACYYMDNGELDFGTHVKEFARVIRPGGYLILSIPKTSNITLRAGKRLKGGYQVIEKDTSKLRNGAVFKIFKGTGDVKKSFGKYFTNFIFGDQHDDCFGWNYHWYLVVCQKRQKRG